MFWQRINFSIHTGTYLLHSMYGVCTSTKRKNNKPVLSENLTPGQIFILQTTSKFRPEIFSHFTPKLQLLGTTIKN